MTHKEKINYMRISAGICRYGFSNEQLDTLVSLYELIIEKKGDGTIDDITKIEIECKKRAETISDDHRQHVVNYEKMDECSFFKKHRKMNVKNRETQPGYYVIYMNGHDEWVPEDEFENRYFDKK